MDSVDEDPSTNGSRWKPDTDDDASVGLRTDSSFSSLFGSDDCPSTTSSGDISGSSGEIPAAVVVEAEIPRLLDCAPAPPDAAGSAARERCVGRSRAVAWGSAALVGRRREMEDAAIVVPEFMSRTCEVLGGCTAPGSRSSVEIGPVHFFGVYDGHGGSQVRTYGALRTAYVLRTTPLYTYELSQIRSLIRFLANFNFSLDFEIIMGFARKCNLSVFFFGNIFFW